MLDAGIAPSTGYKSKDKQGYREAVWSELYRHHCKGTYAVIMPARGCEEIDVAISHGLTENDIFCFDASAAVIATSEWRKKYPNIKFAACHLSDLPKRIAKHGKYVSVANFDFCGTVAGESVEQFDEFMCSGIFYRRGAFAVNIAKGREGKTLLKLLNKLGKARGVDCDRMSSFVKLSAHFDDHNYRAALVKQGAYRENKTPMTWAVFRHRHYDKFPDWLVDWLADAYERDCARDFARRLRYAKKRQTLAETGSVNFSTWESFGYYLAVKFPGRAGWGKRLNKEMNLLGGELK